MTTRPAESLVLHFKDDVDKIRPDLSGVVLMPDGTLWVVSDETRSVERLTFDGVRFDRHRSFDLGALLGLPPGATDEFDLEGLDHDGDYLWLVGGFGARRKAVDDGQSDAKNIQRLAKVDPELDRCLLARVPLVDR